MFVHCINIHDMGEAYCVVSHELQYNGALCVTGKHKLFYFLLCYIFAYKACSPCVTVEDKVDTNLLLWLLW